MQSTLLLALFFVSLTVHAASTVEGKVLDLSGAGVPDATGELRTASNSVLATAVSDSSGRITWPAVAPGTYVLSIVSRNFTRHEEAITVDDASRTSVTIVLTPAGLHSAVTVSASRGVVDDVEALPYVAVVKDRDALLQRPLPTIGNVLENEPGILVQQTTYAQVSPFLRGLTGYQVVSLIDGIRFNNSTFRSGPNQYLAFVEPSQAQRVEALLGPAGSQYGSDSLGGTLNVVTLESSFGLDRTLQTHGEVSAFGASADASAGGAARFSLGTQRVAWLVGASGRKHNDVRAGGGVDSRNVYHKLFGMPDSAIQDFTGNRQQDTGFAQHGFHTKLLARLRPDQLVSLWFQRGVQDNVRGYKDLLGGLGRLQSSFDPQVLNFLYARYEKLALGPFDSVTGTFSLNSQTDGSQRQNLRATDAITRDWNRVNVYGYSGQATKYWGSRALTAFGGDIYDEHIRSERLVTNPVSSAATVSRALYPDRSQYRTFGLFGQQALTLPGRLRLGVGGRLTGIQFQTPQDTRFNVPDTSLSFRDVTFNTSLSWQATRLFGVQGLIGRGFRAPNLNDLGALGLNDLGYEVPSAEAIPAGALLANDAGESAISKGVPLRSLGPESLLNYEIGVRFTAKRLYARVQVFDAELQNPIVRRTLLFPAGQVPAALAGIPVTPIVQTAAQRTQGVVTVATPFDPRSVKAFVNDGQSRYYGLESLLQYAVTNRLSVRANYTFLVGRDLYPNRPIRRLPPQTGSMTVRYLPFSRRIWTEASFHAAGPQDRLSGGDIDDERIGASRRRRDIADFFNGARVQPYVDPATGVFRPTGETLLALQNRVLPLGTVINGVRIVNDDTRVPLYSSTAGWSTVNIRAGVPLGERLDLVLALENMLDKNYRLHGSGVDQPGRNAYLALRWGW